MVGNRIQQFNHILSHEQLLAERIEPFNFMAALIRGSRASPHTLREVARNHRRDQKGKQRHPILSLGNGESSYRRKEEEVERQRGDE